MYEVDMDAKRRAVRLRSEMIASVDDGAPPVR